MDKKKIFNGIIITDILLTLLFIIVLPTQISIRIDNSGNVMYGSKFINLIWIIILVLVSVFINNLAKLHSDKEQIMYKIGMSIAVIWGIVILCIGLLTACGANETSSKVSDATQAVTEKIDVLLTEVSGKISDEEKEEKYIQYIEDYLNEPLIKMEEIEDIDIELVHEGKAYEVTVKIDYADSVQSTETINEVIEEGLQKFLPGDCKKFCVN